MDIKSISMHFPKETLDYLNIIKEQRKLKNQSNVLDTLIREEDKRLKIIK